MKFYFRNQNRYYVYNEEYGTWQHRPPFKVLLNPILRRVQFKSDRPYVFGTRTVFNGKNEPYFIKYTFCRVPIR